MARPTEAEAQVKLSEFIRLCAYGYHPKLAAKEVGYTESTAMEYARRHRDRINEEAGRRVANERPMLVDELIKLAKDENTPANTKLAAIRDALDRGGLQVVSKSEVKHISDEDLDARLLEACGGDRARMDAMLVALQGESLH